MTKPEDLIDRRKVIAELDAIYDCADMTFSPLDHCCKPEDCQRMQVVGKQKLYSQDGGQDAFRRHKKIFKEEYYHA